MRAKEIKIAIVYGRYTVDETGVVYTKGRPMSLTVNRTGRKVVGLRYGNKTKSMQVSRLVAEAFIPNPNNYPEVNHIDGNPLNNTVENLEWCTHKQNMEHAGRLGLHPHTRGVTQIKPCGERVNFVGVRQASMHTGVHNGNIIEVCKGKRKSAGGFSWEYTIGGDYN